MTDHIAPTHASDQLDLADEPRAVARAVLAAGTAAKLTTSQLRQAWAPPCRLQNPTRVPLHGDGAVTVDARAEEAVRALSDVLEDHGYRTRAADTGAYACRPITGGTGYSLHAYGIALDLNWLTNPYRRDGRLVTDMPPEMVEQIKALRTVSGAQVWGWGGDYRTVKDAMHFEIVTTPAHLATGIRPTTNPGEPEMNAQERAQLDAAVTAADAALAAVNDLIERVDVAVRGGKGYQGHDVPPDGILGALNRLEAHEGTTP